jgi:hypothetical protein
MERITSEWTQQVVGVARQQQAYYSYQIAEGDLDNLWSNLYETCMNNNKLLISEADGDGNNVYAGIARIMLAYTLQITVDNWGDIPYSTAFQNVNFLQPTYDPASQVYGDIIQLVDSGIIKLNDPNTGGMVPGDVPGADNIYEGDAAKWIKFGHAIKARLYIHQSKNNAAMAQSALDEANQSFSDNTDNAVYFFGADQTNSNPWFQFNNQRTGDIGYSISTLANTLLSLNDPRYVIYIDSANDGDGFGLAAYFGSSASPVECITNDEINFIKAEAILRSTGDFASAGTAYHDGIQANMLKLGIDQATIDAYITANPMPTTSVDDAIAAVALQEYLALYLNPEAFTLFRRTNVLNLQPPPGAAGDIPRRFLYVGYERSYNAANTPAATLYSPKLFWDN